MAAVEYVRERTPGLHAARRMEKLLRAAGINDIKFFFDDEMVHPGIWTVTQVAHDTERMIMPHDYATDGLRPTKMFLCKTADGRFRIPNKQDVSDIRIIVKRAHTLWSKGGDWMDDQFKKQDDAKNEAHAKQQRERLHAVAPDLKKAVRRELG